MPRIAVVTGTGTEIGKTQTSVALLRVLGRRAQVLGYKPIESGVDGDEGDDGRRLREASTFHVKHTPLRYLFRAALSPHLAARLESRSLDLDAIANQVQALAAEVDVLLVELAGGLFSPVTDALLNVDLLLRIGAVEPILVASDRLGVIHDVTATTRAAATLGVRFRAVVLSPPANPDGSTGRNAEELARFVDIPTIATIPRGTAEAIAASGALDAVAALL